MNKQIIGILLVCLTIFVALSLVGCDLFGSDPKPEYGSLTVSAEEDLSRTIDPGKEKVVVDSYRITGTGPNGATFAPVTATESPINIENLIVGDWDIMVEGLNEEDTPIASDTKTIEIQSGQTTSALFTLTLFEGTGTFELTIQWSSSITSVTSVTAELTPAVEGKDGFTAPISEAVVDGGYYIIARSITEVPTGSYNLNVRFLDASGEQVSLPMMDRVNIYSNMTSSGTFSRPEYWFPVEAPVITPNGGVIDSDQTITLSTTTEGATIYYTLDGSEPNTTCTLYEEPFLLPHNMTVKAIAVRDDMFASFISEVSFEVPLSAPTLSLSSGIYDEPQTLTMSAGDAGVSIYYTLDGSDPTDEIDLYSVPITITENTVVKAVAMHPDFGDSDITTGEYQIRAFMPEFSLREGSYAGTQTVELTSATAGATIYYTLNGDDPTEASEVYENPIQVSSTAIIKAVAGKVNMELSAVKSRTYTILTHDPVANPVFSLVAGTYDSPKQVSLSTTTDEANIYYTFDGTEPTRNSLMYDEPIDVTENTTIKAYAVREGKPDSATVTAEYYIQVASPTFNPEGGTYMVDSQTIEIHSTTPDATIYYTTDGTDPTVGGSIYTSPLSITASTTVKAVAKKDGMADSDVSVANYDIPGTGRIVIDDPQYYTVEIIVPDDWTGEPVITDVGAIITAQVTPAPPEDATFKWHLNGEVARDRQGEITSTTNRLRLSPAINSVEISAGPQEIMVEVSSGDMTYSDHYYFRASNTGTVGESRYVVGDITYETGGSIFYLDEANEYDWTYLEAAPPGWEGGDGPKFRWGGFLLEIGGTSQGIGTGKANTEKIVTTLKAWRDDYWENTWQPGMYEPGIYEVPKRLDSSLDDEDNWTNEYAALMCALYEINGYDGWFLPSIDELDLMYLNLHQEGLGGFTSIYWYWSSSEKLGSLPPPWFWSVSEASAFYACANLFFNGARYCYDKRGSGRVRPVRAF